MFAADLILIVGTSFVSGIAYHLIALGRYGNIETYLGVGILVCGGNTDVVNFTER